MRETELNIPDLPDLDIRVGDLADLPDVSTSLEIPDLPEMPKDLSANAPATSYWEANWMSKVVPREKVTELAAKYGESEEKVYNLLNLRGAMTETKEDEKAAKTFGETGEILPAAAQIAKSTARGVAGSIPAMINSITVGAGWKAARETSDKPELYDEVENLAEANRGKLQRTSEQLLEVASGGVIAKGMGKVIMPMIKQSAQGASLLAKSQRVGNIVSGLLGGGKRAELAGRAVQKATNLLPSSVATGAVGATAGYSGARSSEEEESAAKFGAMFAAIPYAGTVLAKLGSKPAGWVGKKLLDVTQKMQADIGKAERVIAGRAPKENLLYDLAVRHKNMEELTDSELDDLTRILSDSKSARKELNTITKELTDKKYSSNEKSLTRKANEIFIRTEVDRRLQQFGDEYLPKRTAVDKEAFSVHDTINEFTQITDVDEMRRFIKDNKFIEKGQKQRLGATLADDALDTETKLAKAKDSLLTEWLQPRLKALEGKKGAFNSIEDVRSYILEVERTTGADTAYMQDLWRTFRASELMLKENAGKVKNFKWGVIDKVINSITPYSRVADSVDRRWNTNIGYHWTKLLRKLDAFGWSADGLKEDILTPVVKQYETFKTALKNPAHFDEALFSHYQEKNSGAFLRRAAEKGLIDAEDIEKMSIDDAAKLVFQDDDAVKAYKQFSNDITSAWDQLLTEAESTYGMKIERRQNYFRHQMVSPEVAFGRIYKKLEDMRLDLPDNMTRDEHRKLFKSNYNYRQLYSSIKALYNLADHPMPQGYGLRTLDEAVEQISEIGKDTITGRLAPNVYSAYRREGVMPDLLRELDPLKAVEGWIANTLRSKLIRSETAEISKLIPVLEKLGAKEDAAFVKDMVRRAVGVPGETIFGSNKSKMERVKRIVMDNVDSPDEWEKKIKQPEQVQRLLSSLTYTNLLSGPVTALRNLTQTPFVTGTEIGGSYGQAKQMQGLAFAAKMFWKQKMHFDDLQYTGKLPHQLRGEIHSDILKPKTKLDKAEAAAQKYSNAVLWIFGKAEQATRLASIGAARAITADILEGGIAAEQAREFVTKRVSSPSHRKALTESLTAIEKFKKAGNKAEMRKAAWKFEDDAEDYLLERTNFNYSKANMAKVAEKLGPLLSAFTRYTTEIQGAAVDKLRQGMYKEMAEQLLYPAVYMYMFSNGLKAAQQTSEGKRSIDALMGKTAGWIPASSMAGMAGILDQRPPALDMSINIIKALTGDKKAMREAIDDTMNFVPLYRPAVNWVDRFGYRVIMGESKENMPITSMQKALTKPVIKNLGREGTER